MPRDPDKPLTLDEIQELADFMRENELTELEIEESKDSRSIRLRRPEPSAVTPLTGSAGQPPAPAIVDQETAASDIEVIRSPMVGTFYRTPRPGEPAFVEVGGRVREGDVLCVIEAMKLMNHIEAEFDAEIVESLVDNATPVEFGEPLYRVRRL